MIITLDHIPALKMPPTTEQEVRPIIDTINNNHNEETNFIGSFFLCNSNVLPKHC